MSRFPGGKNIFLLYLCLCLFVALTSIGPGRLSAQATDTNPDTWPVALVGSRIGPIGGEMRSVHGGWLGLGLSPTTIVGGGGFGLLRPTTVRTSSVTEVDLDFGYAGVIVERRREALEGGVLIGRLLAGAGHASVRPVGGATEIGADSFAVVEGSFAFGWSPSSRLELDFGPGYRFAFGVDDLEGVRSGDLSGLFLSLSLSIR